LSEISPILVCRGGVDPGGDNIFQHFFTSYLYSSYGRLITENMVKIYSKSSIELERGEVFPGRGNVFIIFLA